MHQPSTTTAQLPLALHLPDTADARGLIAAGVVALALHLALLLGMCLASFERTHPVAADVIEVLIMPAATIAPLEDPAATADMAQPAVPTVKDVVPSLTRPLEAMPSLRWERLVADPRPPLPDAATPRDQPPPLPPVNVSADRLRRHRPTRDPAAILAARAQALHELAGGASAARATSGRRRAISASTREYRYASYLDAWTHKVERIGNLNYPREAREQGLHGSLLLRVELRADGTVAALRVVRSSGHALLDRAAQRIVQLGAPYAPFPPDIAAEIDILEITRAWQFTRGGRLGSGG